MSAGHRESLLQAIKEKNYIVIKNIMHERGLDIADEWIDMLFSVQHTLGKRISPENFVTALLSAPDEREALEFMNTALSDNGVSLDSLLPDILQLAGSGPSPDSPPGRTLYPTIAPGFISTEKRMAGPEP